MSGARFKNRFRKPVELVSVATSLTCVVVLWTWPRIFLVTPAIGGVMTVGLLTLAGVRGYQAARLLRFQRNLKRLPAYQMRPQDIPVSSAEQFLGRGFYWAPEHTQRLHMARLPEYRHLRARNDLYEWARDFERSHPGSRLARLLQRPAWWNPVAPLPPVGGDPAIHGVEPREADVYTDLRERVGHTLVLGTTRVGKTRWAEIQVTQDIRRGDVVIVFDPKGDVDLLLRMYTEAKRCGREQDLTFFHLGYPHVSARYSPIGTFARITEVATRIAGQLPGEGQSATFREFVWRFINVMARAMTALGMKPTYEMVYQNAVNIDGLCLKYFEFWLNRDHPGWRNELPEADRQVQEQARKTGRAMLALQILALMRERGWQDPIADGLASVLTNDRSYFEKLVSSLYPLLEKLTTGKVAELLSPDYDDPNDPRPVFDWTRVIDQGGIVYVGLDALSDFEVAAAVGNAMFADLTSTAGRIYKYGNGFGQTRQGAKRSIDLYADEFNELCGDEFIPMLNKAGGAGVRVTALTQTDADIEAKIGSKAKAQQMFGNFNTLVMLRVKNSSTAEVLTDQLAMTQIWIRTTESGASDAEEPGEFVDFTAKTADKWTPREVPMIEPTDLVQLPKGQAFALIDGGQLVKLRLPLAKDEGDPIAIPGLDGVITDMRARYGRQGAGDDDADAAPDWPLNSGEALTVEGKGAGF
ncbi:type IV conjugative transfer system coupling protein TraD [Pandoraea sp.]|uniref:type IV conjugative transfer system coupling protein TraD n=1 Tax=Pandoraea sp. TaxID=1883445 RepID=UPI0012007EF1|nr:type IV conjugative transfer system coupling protein TraD [Pandoraea sp.]TAL56897.1 MAG: type IV conjugative transfer system coupling protein TraD [Pandoraea sp.]TAM17691.1 MAG: type IV conjugative transfer system coupling protein TraD [Pandoraea sp.]